MLKRTGQSNIVENLQYKPFGCLTINDIISPYLIIWEFLFLICVNRAYYNILNYLEIN